MLSHHKLLIRVAEVVALVATGVAFSVATYAHTHPAATEPFELAVIAMFALDMFSFGIACALAGEFVRSVRQPTTLPDRYRGLSSAKITGLFKWAPIAYKLAAIVAIIVVVITGFTIGSVEWSSSEAFTPQLAVGAMLYLAGFFLFALPVLGSAARMPGAYEDNVAVLRRDA
ncbi:MAG: hypothetical protein H7Z20_08825 [Bdellovibrio sp.]|nr:hypothetical protein [Methylotenera sp.]